MYMYMLGVRVCMFVRACLLRGMYARVHVCIGGASVSIGCVQGACVYVRTCAGGACAYTQVFLRLLERAKCPYERPALPI